MKMLETKRRKKLLPDYFRGNRKRSSSSTCPREKMSAFYCAPMLLLLLHRIFQNQLLFRFIAVSGSLYIQQKISFSGVFLIP